jgi:hypothetical protein
MNRETEANKGGTLRLLEAKDHDFSRFHQGSDSLTLFAGAFLERRPL